MVLICPSDLSPGPR
uniref:Uncharacterized protein n=1 Tax=Anguilla anguilla TaxID=7936 RepID=A0A0E9X9F7_ANGAN